MAREEILLDFSNSETYECGAMLLAVLAYPSGSDGVTRHELGTSLCVHYLRSRMAKKLNLQESRVVVSCLYSLTACRPVEL